jgi:hypothetical protein
MAVIDINMNIQKDQATGIPASKFCFDTCQHNLYICCLDANEIQVALSINNCPPPSRIFHGRQAILEKMHEFFERDLDEQKIYLLHGLGGSGKTQIALKFIVESSSR